MATQEHPCWMAMQVPIMDNVLLHADYFLFYNVGRERLWLGMGVLTIRFDIGVHNLLFRFIMELITSYCTSVSKLHSVSLI